MSQFLRFSVSLVCVVMLASDTLAQSRWSFVGLTTDYDICYVDRAIKKKASGVIQAWEKIIYQDKSYSIGLVEWRCSEKMKRLIQVNSYGPVGEYLSRSLSPLTWRYVVPDSVEEKTYEVVCNSSSEKPSKIEKAEKIVSGSLLAQIIVKKANLRSEAGLNSEIIREVGSGEKLILMGEEPVGVWYQVLDLKTNSQGWLNGNNFKIVKVRKSAGKSKRTRRKIM